MKPAFSSLRLITLAVISFSLSSASRSTDVIVSYPSDFGPTGPCDTDESITIGECMESDAGFPKKPCTVKPFCVGSVEENDAELLFQYYEDDDCTQGTESGSIVVPVDGKCALIDQGGLTCGGRLDPIKAKVDLKSFRKACGAKDSRSKSSSSWSKSSSSSWSKSWSSSSKDKDSKWFKADTNIQKIIMLFIY